MFGIFIKIHCSVFFLAFCFYRNNVIQRKKIDFSPTSPYTCCQIISVLIQYVDTCCQIISMLIQYVEILSFTVFSHDVKNVGGTNRKHCRPDAISCRTFLVHTCALLPQTY